MDSGLRLAEGFKPCNYGIQTTGCQVGANAVKPRISIRCMRSFPRCGKMLKVEDDKE